MKPKRCTLAGFLAAAALAGGCALPVPLPDRPVLSGTPVSPEQMVFLHPAVTTKAEVIERLGPPSIVWEDARVIVYDWELRWGILIWAVGGPYSGAAGIVDVPTHHLLIMEFDEAWRVRRFEHTTHDSLQPYWEFLLEWKASGRGMPTSASPSSSERLP